MKVMCIDDSFYDDGCNPKVSEIVTISGESPYYKGNIYLKEYPTNKWGLPQSYNRKHFALTSDIDETELAEQREQLQTV